MTTKWRINQITQRCLQAGWYQIFNEKGQMAGFCLHDEKTARKMAASSEMYEILKGLPFKLKANGADEREEIDEAIQEIERLIERIDGKEHEVEAQE